MARDGSVIIATELDNKSFDAQLNSLEKKLQQEEKTLQKMLEFKPIVKDGQTFSIDTAKLERQQITVEKTRNQIIDLRNRMAGVGQESDKTSEKINKNFNKGVKSIKRFGLSLFSIRSIYALVSRASSAYLSRDTELANKLQSVWAGLGSFLAPLIQWITDILSKGLGYLNVFVKALTGVDFIANANAKAIKKQADAQKELNKQLYSFDEINKLSDSEVSSGVSVDSSLFKMPELDDRIVKKLQDLAYWLKENWNWLKLVGEMFLIVFGANKIAEILSNIAPLLGEKGLGGILTGLNGILTIGAIGITIFLVGNIIKDVQNLKKELQDIRKIGFEAQKEAIKNEKDINQLLTDQAVNRQANYDMIKKSESGLYWLLGLSKEGLETAKKVVENSEVYLEQLKSQYDLTKLQKDEKNKILNSLIEQFNYNNLITKKLEEQGEDTSEVRRITGLYLDEINRVAQSLGISNDKLNEMVKKTADSNENTKGLYDTIKDINNTKLTNKSATYTITAKANTKNAEKDYSNFFSKVGESISHVFDSSKWGKGFLSGLKSIWTKKMAVGGIINNPGRGVALGSNIVGGEAGREGVLPLTDASVMSALGAEIGKYVSVNNLVDVNYDGQRIKRISKSSDSRDAIMRNR